MGAPAWAAGLWLYEMGTPDLGTASAGRVAMAADASTAGMTRLERSQMLAAFQGIYVNSRFDTEIACFVGGDGGNAGRFVPSGGLHFVHSLTPDWKFGISAGSYFGLGVDYGNDGVGRYYTTEIELLTFGIPYRSQVDLDFTDVAGLKNIGPVLQGPLNFSGLVGINVDIDMTIPRAVMLSAYH